jgi:flavin-binding protein dodecin
MKIEFENGSSIESIDMATDNTRSKRAEEYIKNIRYFRKYPASGYVRGANIKLHWYQRLILNIMDLWYRR